MDSALWSIRSSTPVSVAGANRHSLLYCGPCLFFEHGHTDAVGRKEATAQDTESCERRVMVTPNTDGNAYTLDEFIEFFCDRFAGMREWEKAVPVSLVHQKQQQAPWLGSRSAVAGKDGSNDDTFLHIKNALMTLLDEGEMVVVPRRHKVPKAKLRRSALIWSRLVKKMLLFLRNDPTGRLCFGRYVAIGA